MNETGKFWQYIKRAKLYFDLFKAMTREPCITLGSLYMRTFISLSSVSNRGVGMAELFVRSV